MFRIYLHDFRFLNVLLFLAVHYSIVQIGVDGAWAAHSKASVKTKACSRKTVLHRKAGL